MDMLQVGESKINEIVGTATNAFSLRSSMNVALERNFLDPRNNFSAFSF
jgi:hypothetical protein